MCGRPHPELALRWIPSPFPSKRTPSQRLTVIVRHSASWRLIPGRHPKLGDIQMRHDAVFYKFHELANW